MPTLDFKGKQHIYAHHLTVPYRPLVADAERSLNAADVDDNLIIHGDNLHALKALLPRYAGKVKCIYIDPPYNTGNEGWVYNDNANSPLMKEWVKQNSPVDGEDLERHDKWLCMMWPRLHLLKELLSDDGVIFVSIDDNEQHHLRMLMDEIFGEVAFLADFIWKSRQNRDNRNVTGASIDHEYILCYGVSIRGDDRKTGLYSNPDNDPRGDWASGNMVGLATQEARPNLHFDLFDPEAGINYGCPARGWRYDQRRMAELISDNRILWPENSEGRPRVKNFLRDLTTTFTGFSSIVGDGVFTRSGTREIEEVFASRVFEFPKSKELIRQLILQGCPDDGIVLDSFAGSGTTAHAVLALNKEDGGNRKFILVECEDYADTITAERVRRVIKGVPDARDASLREGLGGSFLDYALREHVKREVETQAERAFHDKLRQGEIRFDLEAGQPNFRMVESYDIPITDDYGLMAGNNGLPVQLSLFEPIYTQQFDSGLERNFARYLDEQKALHWWHRVAVRQRGDYYLRGWKQERIWPDFVAMGGETDGKPHVLVFETKGEHLRDNPDTDYKQRVLETLQNAYNCGTMTVKDGPAKGTFRLVFNETEFPAALASLNGVYTP